VTAPDGLRYQDRVVVVTGARKGLGRILATYFIGCGARVIGISRGPTDLEHQSYRHLQLDVGDDTAVRAGFVDIGRSHGSVDIVINNAAVAVALRALMTPAPRAEEMVRTNLLGSFYVSREAAKLMRRSESGRIINIGSMHTVLEPVGASIYAATKAALATLTGVLAKELSSYGITVNSLAITALETDMLGQLSRDLVEELVASLPIPRLATPDDVTNVVDFFASPASSYITAQTIYLGGVHR
jgi:3-oxoacyl-[acyl-carrier protein] reductase